MPDKKTAKGFHDRISRATAWMHGDFQDDEEFLEDMGRDPAFKRKMRRIWAAIDAAGMRAEVEAMLKTEYKARGKETDL